MKQIRKRLTYANVMSSIAVFLILGGGAAFAAGKLGKNSVGTKQLKNNAVTTAKIKKGAVTGSKVNLSSLGKVPSASNADNAGNANTVGGMTVSKIAYSATSGSAPQQVLNTQGLILTATCTGSSPTVTATTNVPEGVGVEFNSEKGNTGTTLENIFDDGTGGIFTTGDVLVNSRQRGSFTFQTSQGHVVSGVFDGDNSPALHNKAGLAQANCTFVATINAG